MTGGVSCVEPRIRPARSEDLEEAARVLAEAFDGYPWTAWTVDARDHRERLRVLYLTVLQEVVLPFGAAWVAEVPTEARHRLVGAAGWLTVEPVPPEAWERVAGLERQLRGDRWEAHVRAEAQLDDVRPTSTGWLLGAVGVHPLHRRRGVAQRLLRPGLDAATAAGSAVRLETSDPANVAFYRRLGFEVTDTVVVYDRGPVVWLMCRRP